MFDGCAFPTMSGRSLPSKGFWRVDKEKVPEQRQTILTVAAFTDLFEYIRTTNDEVNTGIRTFLGQNQGDGWLLPETLSVTDLPLHSDNQLLRDRMVARPFGSRFSDWQLVQAIDESWQECRLHARNILGTHGYEKLLADIDRKLAGSASDASELPPHAAELSAQSSLFG